VASKFMICLWGTGVLPEAAAELLAEGTPTTASDRGDASCTALSTEQARFLAAALDDAGARRDSTNSEPEFYYELVDAAGQRAGLMFTPLLPHGEAPCLLCG
jgi:hypothetical protein